MPCSPGPSRGGAPEEGERRADHAERIAGLGSQPGLPRLRLERSAARRDAEPVHRPRERCDGDREREELGRETADGPRGAPQVDYFVVPLPATGAGTLRFQSAKGNDVYPSQRIDWTSEGGATG